MVVLEMSELLQSSLIASTELFKTDNRSRSMWVISATGKMTWYTIFIGIFQNCLADQTQAALPLYTPMLSISYYWLLSMGADLLLQQDLIWDHLQSVLNMWNPDRLAPKQATSERIFGHLHACILVDAKLSHISAHLTLSI